jgi:hypothetical protein
MKKLYSVKEIAEMLNRELEQQGVDYRYTEERVRSRLRYLRSKGVHDEEEPLVSAKVVGYDRRAKYYSEEDVEKLRHIWIGPMLPEFEVNPEDTSMQDRDDNEVLVRPAESRDIEQIAATLPSATDGEKADMHAHLGRLFKQQGSKSFVAIAYDEHVIGWAHAEISPAMSLVRGTVAGTIRFHLSTEVEMHRAAARALIFRSQWWLLRHGAGQIVVEVPAEMHDLESLLESMRMQPEGTMKYYRADTL